jgi:hypothetical protein
MLQAGTIAGGDIGDGIRGWGVKGTSAVPVQSVNTIANLTASGPLSRFTGFRDGTSPGASAIDRYISLYGQYSQANAPPTIIEIHRGAEIVRNNNVDSLNKCRAPGVADLAPTRKRNRAVASHSPAAASALVEATGPVTYPDAAATTATVDDPMDVESDEEERKETADARSQERTQREQAAQQDDLLRQLQQGGTAG